jgi:hypothetical protein
VPVDLAALLRWNRSRCCPLVEGCRGSEILLPNALMQLVRGISAPRVTIPFATAVTAAHADRGVDQRVRPPVVHRAVQKMWHGESTWVTVLPWNMKPSCSDEKPQRRSSRVPGSLRPY